MIGGTSGSETKLFQPSASQSNRTQTRSSSLGSRNTCAPLEPCCLRFSAPFVEKILSKRSKSSTVVVARIILYSSDEGGPRSFRPEPRTEGTPTDPTDGGDDCHPCRELSLQSLHAAGSPATSPVLPPLQLAQRGPARVRATRMRASARACNSASS